MPTPPNKQKTEFNIDRACTVHHACTSHVAKGRTKRRGHKRGREVLGVIIMGGKATALHANEPPSTRTERDDKACIVFATTSHPGSGLKNDITDRAKKSGHNAKNILGACPGAAWPSVPTGIDPHAREGNGVQLNEARVFCSRFAILTMPVSTSKRPTTQKHTQTDKHAATINGDEHIYHGSRSQRRPGKRGQPELRRQEPSICKQKLGATGQASVNRSLAYASTRL